MAEKGVRNDVRRIVEKRISLNKFRQLSYVRGHSIQDIADRVSVSKSTVERYMKRHGLKRRLSKYNLTFNDVSEKDLVYFAGLFDDEGNITATIDASNIIRAQ